MNTKEAARELNMTELSLKMLMQQNRLPIGHYIIRPGATKGRYHIDPERLKAYKRQQGTLSEEDVDRIAHRVAALITAEIQNNLNAHSTHS